MGSNTGFYSKKKSSKMANTKEKDDLVEDEELQRALYGVLEDLLFFLKHCPLNGSFRSASVRAIIKLGVGQVRPQVNAYITPIAASCLPMLFGFLAEGTLQALEDHLLCADAAAALLGMFPAAKAATLVSHCLHVSSASKSLVDFSEGETGIFMKLTVNRPLLFKLCMSRGLLQNQHCLTPAVMELLAEPITTACYQHSPLTCLGFRTLHMWLSHWKKMDYCLKNTVSSNIYSIVADNWENKIPGVRKENGKVLAALLDVACPSTEFTTEAMFLHVMKDMSWKMKSKYFFLNVLMPKYGVLKALEEYPSLVPALVASLGTGRLSCSGADTYRVCLAAIPDVHSWCQWFLQPLLELFSSEMKEQRRTQLNLISHWLTPTLRKFPALTQILHNHLISAQSKSPRIELATSALLHLGRKEGFVTELWPEYSLVEAHLVHGDEEVRKHAFGAVCKKTKKFAPPPAEEFEAVKKFLKENINIDKSTLRQSVVESFSHFLERLYASSVKLMASKMEAERSLLMPTFAFLSWVHEFLLGNLKLGGNYQRIITTLQLYLEVFKHFGPRAVRASSETESLKALAKALGGWDFDSPESWCLLLECVLSSTKDIQKTAADILASHLRLLEEEDEEGAARRAARLWALTLRQCRSAVFHEAESGAALMRLLVQFLLEAPHLSFVIPPAPHIVKNGECLDLLLDVFSGFSLGLDADSADSELCDEASNVTKTCPEVQNSSATQTTDETMPSDQSASTNLSEKAEDTADLNHQKALQPLISYWQRELDRQWVVCQEDVFRAVTNDAALHGILGAFVHLVPHFTQYDVARMLVRLGRIVDYFLGLLSGQAQDTGMASPSFAEMAEAIAELLPAEEQRRCSAQLSPAHQLTLSCVWLTLRESCRLAAALLRHPLASGTDAVRCVMLVERILLRCRYKGTVEAAGASLAVMVRHVTSERETRRCLPRLMPECSERLCDFLEDVLLRALEAASTGSGRTSVTRCSAGAGVLVQKVVAADSRPGKPLLRVCLGRLCNTVENPPPTVHTLEECDLPQASALHLLCRLAQDASLHLELLPYASTIALLCFHAFSSPAWTVRNAALQLFGVLVPLLIGEKKVQDDDLEAFGNITTEQFLSHHPSLVAFFLEEMHKAESHSDMSTNIVPILSFLSKLTFGDNWSADNCDSELQDLQENVNLLMKDSRLMVRKLAAKCYSRFIPPNILCKSIEILRAKMQEAEDLTENKLHGILIALQYLVHRFMEEGADVERFRRIRQILQEVPMTKVSWINKMKVLEVMELVEMHCDDKDIYDYLKLVRIVLRVSVKCLRSRIRPRGIRSWAFRGICFASARCNEKDLCSIWTMLYANDRDALTCVCTNTVRNRIPELSLSTKEQLMNTLLSSVCKGWSKDWRLLNSILTALLELTPYVRTMTSSRVIHMIFSSAEKEQNLQGWSVALPVTCEMYVSYIENCCSFPEISEFLKLLAVETLSRTAADKCDVDTRVHAARAFVALFQALLFLHSQDTEIGDAAMYVDIVETVLDCGIALLQDENSSVRQEASRLLRPEQNPYERLLTLLSVDGLLGVLNHFHIARYFQRKLLDMGSYEALLAEGRREGEAVVGSSPFEVRVSNIYAEEAHVLSAMADSFLPLLQQNASWLPDLPVLPQVQTVQSLVTRLLHVWEESPCPTPEVNLFLLRLKVLAELSDKVSPGSTEDYVTLREHVKLSLKTC